MAGYWSAISQARTSRRRALIATTSTAAAAAFLAACGGSGSSSTSAPAKNEASLVATPVDTSKQAKTGGTFKWYSPSEPAHFDIHQGLNPLNTPSNLTTDYMVNEKSGVLKPPEYSEVIPDLADSWEWSPDRLQLTLKLRDGVRWHNKPPVNGRLFDANDVTFSWTRYAASSQGRGNLANSANPNAVVLSVTAPDPKHVALKLKEPVVYLLSQLTPGQTGNFGIFPKEAEGGYDPRKDLIGNGPFVLSSYQPSAGMTFKRNPEYWDIKNGPYIETIEYPTVSEYAQQLAQFKAGNIHTMTGGTSATPRPEDIVPVKKDLNDILIYQVLASGFSPGNSIEFGTQPTDANKSFKDERVRQAFQMALDRDAYIDVFKNVSNFQKQGLPVGTYWYTAIGTAPGWRIDPKDDKAFGPNAQYYQHDVAKAKSMLAAAGYASGLDVITSYIKGTELGVDFQKTVEVRQEMLRNIGIRPQTNLIDYTTEYLPKYLANAGKFDGVVYRSGVAPGNDAMIWLNWRYKSGSGDGWVGFDAAGKGDGSGDPQVDALIVKARQELDIEKRKALVSDLQKYLAKAAYCISEPGTADTFDLAWPAMSNYRSFNGDRRTAVYRVWMDDTKPPAKKS